MTADQHRAIGRILGFPSCCVEAFVADVPHGIPSGAERGVVIERDRTVEEMRALAQRVSELLGRPWPTGGFDPLLEDMRKAYVPCPAHVGSEGWQS
jgi:hypothetical protein